MLCCSRHLVQRSGIRNVDQKTPAVPSIRVFLLHLTIAWGLVGISRFGKGGTIIGKMLVPLGWC